jgi:Uma2 family endonuclease
MIAEVIRGELRLSPRPAFPHATVASFLHTMLSSAFTFGHGGGPGGWIILFEPELHFRRDIVVPDLAGWRNTRLPAVPDVAYSKLAPDWLCEVHSRSTRKHDIADKLPIYAAAGVRNVWLIHPVHRTLEVLRLQRRQWRLLGVHRDDQVVRAEPFDAIELDLGVLWARLARTGRPPRASEGRPYHAPRVER